MGPVPSPQDTGFALVKPLGGEPILVPMARPIPARGEAVLRVLSVGLCRTDLLIAEGRIAVARDRLILGHEFSGIVEAIDGPADIAIGDLVAVDPTFERPDGSDGFMGRDVDGCLARWAVVPTARLFAVPAGLTPAQAAYLEPVAAALGGVEAAARYAGEAPGLLVGDNRIATLTAALLRSQGLAFEQISHAGLRDGVAAGSARNRWPWLLETRLEDDLFTLAAEALRPHGALILKSRHSSTATFPAARWAERQLSIVGRSRAAFPAALAWLAAHRADIAPLLGATFPLTAWRAAFTAAGTGEAGKIFIDPAMPSAPVPD